MIIHRLMRDVDSTQEVIVTINTDVDPPSVRVAWRPDSTATFRRPWTQIRCEDTHLPPAPLPR